LISNLFFKLSDVEELKQSIKYNVLKIFISNLILITPEGGDDQIYKFLGAVNYDREAKIKYNCKIHQ